jgi:exopolyphosphatase/guanosine-5'-triphosphate,3'-diphosphate pyrophosphatase
MADAAADADSTANPSAQEQSLSDTFAAVDLGSNSFHLLVARVDGGTLQVIDR